MCEKNDAVNNCVAWAKTRDAINYCIFCGSWYANRTLWRLSELPFPEVMSYFLDSPEGGDSNGI